MYRHPLISTDTLLGVCALLSARRLSQRSKGELSIDFYVTPKAAITSVGRGEEVTATWVTSRKVTRLYKKIAVIVYEYERCPAAPPPPLPDGSLALALPSRREPRSARIRVTFTRAKPNPIQVTLVHCKFRWLHFLPPGLHQSSAGAESGANAT